MYGGDGATDHVPLKLTARSKERKQQQKIDQGRREMVRRYWHDNRDHLWCIDPNLRGKGIGDSIDTLMNTCEDKYNGNFALMMRNLHHDAVQLKQQSSVQTQMVVRPPVTCRINASLEVRPREWEHRHFTLLTLRQALVNPSGSLSTCTQIIRSLDIKMGTKQCG